MKIGVRVADTQIHSNQSNWRKVHIPNQSRTQNLLYLANLPENLRTLLRSDNVDNVLNSTTRYFYCTEKTSQKYAVESQMHHISILFYLHRRNIFTMFPTCVRPSTKLLPLHWSECCVQLMQCRHVFLHRYCHVFFIVIVAGAIEHPLFCCDWSKVCSVEVMNTQYRRFFPHIRDTLLGYVPVWGAGEVNDCSYEHAPKREVTWVCEIW